MFRATALLALLPAAALGFMAPALPMGSVVRHGSIAGAAAPSSLLLRSDRVKAASSGAVAGARMAGLKGIGFPELQAKGMRVGIVHSRWNAEVVTKLREGAKSALLENGIKEDDIVEFEVPGSWELPLATRFMAQTQKVDAVIAIGVLVKGETDHYDMIKDAATNALMMLGVETGIPTVCGILGVHNMEQAEARATGDSNHGVWWGKTAIEMAQLRQMQMGKGPLAGSGAEKKKILF